MADFHSKPFDEATLLKLDIYKSYIKDWFPVFVQNKPHFAGENSINVFDFFCGPGRDGEGRDGSPIIAWRTCLEYSTAMKSNNIKANLYFNDSNQSKIDGLKLLLSDFPIIETAKINYSAKSFIDAYTDFLPKMQGAPNLLFIDQCGVKEVNKSVFQQLIRLPRTDFLLFISSSYFWRFLDAPEFKRHIDASSYLNREDSYSDCHRSIAAMYKDWISRDLTYYLAPFSIRKGANIYGLIFGSSNLLGIWKFLKILWKIDPERGEANFDIDNDNLPQQYQSLRLFDSNDKSSKVSKFQAELQQRIMKGEFDTDKSLATFCLTNGFLPVCHAKPILKSLVSENRVKAEGQIRLSEACLKTPRKITLC